MIDKKTQQLFDIILFVNLRTCIIVYS